LALEALSDFSIFFELRGDASLERIIFSPFGLDTRHVSL
jgi:hypothetical protein